MTRQTFHAQLTHLQERLLQLGAAAEVAVNKAVDSLEAQDLEEAQAVLDGDNELDKLQNEIEEEVLKLIALQQPLARDLRTLGAILQTATDLERVGDYAENIAERTLWIGKEPLIKPLVDIPKMARMSEAMLRDSLDSFVKRDVQLAQKVVDDDEAVDQIYATLFDELMDYVSSGNVVSARQAVQLLFVARYLERIADHATNVAERVIYMVTGEWIAHKHNTPNS